MRTTLDIDDDVLNAAKERARRENTTAGKVISQLARQSLIAPRPTGVAEPGTAYGFTPFESRGAVITNELIDKLRTDDVY